MDELVRQLSDFELAEVEAVPGEQQMWEHVKLLMRDMSPRSALIKRKYQNWWFTARIREFAQAKWRGHNSLWRRLDILGGISGKKTVMQYDRDDRMGLRRWSFSMLILMSSWAASLAPTTKMKWCYQNLDNDPRHFSKHINTTLLQLLNNKKISPECHKH